MEMFSVYAVILATAIAIGAHFILKRSDRCKTPHP